MLKPRNQKTNKKTRERGSSARCAKRNEGTRHARHQELSLRKAASTCAGEHWRRLE
jgi:hypothetical protein